MLHPVPDSTARSRLLAVVEMQRRLLDALCSLAPSSVVDLAWLKMVWSDLPVTWTERFWENDKGNRNKWINIIAGASVTEKQTISDMMAEQLRFAELYHKPPSLRLTLQDWSPPVFAAANKLLKSFYDPLFYQREGFPNPDGTRFHKEMFIEPRPKICPYTDNYIQDTKLDHFLPKEQFPMLSCHPDNLIPCGTDANSGGHKGTTIPLDLDAPDQAASWFHPRWCTAKDKYRLEFEVRPSPQVRITFVAVNADDQPRLDNMVRIFGLCDFWGGILDDEVQELASDVQGMLQFDGVVATEMNVRERVKLRVRQERSRIGRFGLAIAKSFFYEHIANTPLLLSQVVRICNMGT